MTKPNKVKIPKPVIKKEKVKKISEKEVGEFLHRTGFVFEMVVAEQLKKLGFKVSVNQYFLDLETDKKREIDIIATKEINKVDVKLIIECKKSIKDAWVFVCSDSKPARYYLYIKHLPRIKKMHDSKIFNHTHVLSGAPISQNYTTFDIHTKKPSEGKQIDKALEKLPKALLDVASTNDKKTLFLPMVVFNGQIFSAKYSTDLEIKEEESIYHATIFESESYKKSFHKKSPLISEAGDIFGQPVYSSFLSPEERKVKNIRETHEKLGSNYAICFVSNSNLEKYVERIEKDIENISIRKWSFDVNKQGK